MDGIQRTQNIGMSLIIVYKADSHIVIKRQRAKNPANAQLALLLQADQSHQQQAKTQLR